MNIRYAISDGVFSGIRNNTIFKIPNKVCKITIKSCKKGGNSSLKYILKAIFIIFFFSSQFENVIRDWIVSLYFLIPEEIVTFEKMNLYSRSCHI